MSASELDPTWEAVRAELRSRVTDLAFHLWLDPLELVGDERGTLYVRAPGHVRTLVEERYLSLIRTAAGRALERGTSVELVDEAWVGPERAPSRSADHAPTGAPAVALNPRYSFDQFVIGDSNRLAHAAALAVAEQPGQAFNPLFLHGPPGLGKTHLLHAIGNYVRAYGGGLSVRYETSDEFTSGFVGAIRAGSAEEFKAAFRATNVLLLDDVQVLADRTRTREELFHSFNALYEAGCQVVVTSDRSPDELTAFERRLADRFGSGLVAALEPPSLAVRTAILRKRVALDELPELDHATVVELARLVPASVRALEGALVRLIAYASLRGEPPTPSLVRSLLGKLEPARCGSGGSTIVDIQRATAEHFGLSSEQLLERDRRPAVAFARQVAMYLARELTGESLPRIAAGFGGRNHSTVLHAHRRIAGNLRTDPQTARAVDSLRGQLQPADADRPR